MITKSKLIVLRGIYPGDFYRRKPATKEVKKVQSLYTPIPTVFDGPELWPISSNLKCWSCSLLFQGYPRFAPRNSRGHGTEFRCDVVGVMCSWSCVARYILDKFPVREQADALDIICLIEAMFTGGERKARIMPAPDKTVRAEYCGLGGMSSDEYREKTRAAEEHTMVGWRFDDWRPAAM